MQQIFVAGIFSFLLLFSFTFKTKANTVFNPFTTDTIVACGKSSLLLDAGYGYQFYKWNTGQETQAITVTYNGKYAVSVTDADNQTFTDSVVVMILDYTLNGFTTQHIPIPKVSQPTGTPPAWVSTLSSFNAETVQSFTQSVNWQATKDGFIDSLTFYVEVASNFFGQSAKLYITFEEGKHCNPINYIATVTVSDSGYVTVPIGRPVRRGYYYSFGFERAYNPAGGNTTALRTCSMPGLNWKCQAISTGVWFELHGYYFAYPNPGKEFYSCFSDSLNMAIVSNENFAYLWGTGSNSASVNVLPKNGDVFPFTVSNSQTTCFDTARVEVFNTPFNPIEQDTLFSCLMDTVSLNTYIYDYISYKWNNGNITEDLKVTVEGKYTVDAISDRGCKATEGVYVVVPGPIRKFYRFTGNGLYSEASNWVQGGGEYFGMPPSVIGPHETIIIDPVGECIMDVEQVVYGCGEFQVVNAGKLLIRNHLILKE